MKSRDQIRRIWKSLVFFAVGVLFLLAPSDENAAVCYKLGHQIYSMDDTHEKIVQSYPKAERTHNAMKGTGGIMKHLLVASEAVWHVKALPLSKLPEWIFLCHTSSMIWGGLRRQVAVRTRMPTSPRFEFLSRGRYKPSEEWVRSS
jgi:hypothetical protein